MNMKQARPLRPISISKGKPVSHDQLQNSQTTKSMIKSTNDSNPFLKIFSDPSRVIEIKQIPYLILGTIYKGEFSVVYRVQNLEGDLFALKDATIKSPDILEAYTHETRLIHTMRKCTRSIRTYAFEIQGTHIKILMELGECSLDDIARRPNGLSPNDLRMIWQQLIECISELHQNNQGHGNPQLKHFVMVQHQLKLVDYGITNDVGQKRISRTSNYRAPELVDKFKQGLQCEEHRLHDGTSKFEESLLEKADVWSLGCLLYELATGQALVMSQSRKLKLNISIIGHRYPNDCTAIKDVLLDCLVTDPMHRASITDLLNHDYIQCPMEYRTNHPEISTYDNLKYLAAQILTTSYVDADFESENGMRYIEALSRALISGVKMDLP